MHMAYRIGTGHYAVCLDAERMSSRMIEDRSHIPWNMLSGMAKRLTGVSNSWMNGQYIILQLKDMKTYSNHPSVHHAYPVVSNDGPETIYIFASSQGKAASLLELTCYTQDRAFFKLVGNGMLNLAIGLVVNGSCIEIHENIFATRVNIKITRSLVKN